MCKSRLWRWTALFTGSLQETWKGVCIPGTLRHEWWAQVGDLSPRELKEANLEGGSFSGDTEGYAK